MVLKTFCDLNSWKVPTNVFCFSRVAGSQSLNNELLHGYFLKILTAKLTAVFMKYIFGAFKKYVTLEEGERGRWKKWQILTWEGASAIRKLISLLFFFLCVHFSCNSVFPSYVSDGFLVTSQSTVMKISLHIRSFFWSVFSCIRTRKNSVFGHFSRSENSRGCLYLYFSAFTERIKYDCFETVDYKPVLWEIFAPLCQYNLLAHLCLCVRTSVGNNYNWDFASDVLFEWLLRWMLLNLLMKIKNE